MLWCYLRCRGQPPRFFLRDDYTNLTQKQSEQLDKAYSLIIEFLGVPRAGGNLEPIGVISVSTPRWKGFTFPRDLKEKITEGLTEILHPDSGIPSGLKIPGYSNLL